MKPREAVQWFSREMESKLRENDHKGGWRGERFAHLFPRIGHERDELLLSVQGLNLDTIDEKLTNADACEIIRECADIANFAMMIADNIRMKMEAKRK